MHSLIKSIDTEYNGYRFRSRLEARWAVFFDALGLRYEYEQEGLELDGIFYLPDFWLPDNRMYVEIKPSTDSDLEKPKRLAATKTNTIVIQGNPWWGKNGPDYCVWMPVLKDLVDPEVWMFVLDKLVTAELSGDEAEVRRWEPEFEKTSRIELARFSPVLFSVCTACRRLRAIQRHPYPEPGSPEYLHRPLDRGHNSPCGYDCRDIVYSTERMFRLAKQARFEFGETPVP